MIKINNICKHYGKHKVLSNINVSIPKGQMTSLIGPNGAGKSTLLMIIAKLLNPTSGAVWLDKRTINTIKTANFAHLVATLRQTNNFNLRLNVEELIAFGRFPYSHGTLTKADWQIINDSIDFMGLDKLRHRYIDEISGGQRQMAFLAMTIAQQTDVLLLDEPLNNLDMKHSVQVMQALRRLSDEQGRTVVLVIHDINFAANYSDFIIALKDGEILFDGAVNKVINQANLSELYELEFQIHQLKFNNNYKQGYLCNYFM
ncbi:iron ABC transporter ATP-binding protein [Psychrobacter lutiphocae]|uniref:iron ABC transporter ATP-binding protein n=1 Tax=Psychrobacter lutiphocae TaxID=540500 RepID=UPI000373A52A|nr:ATP-binding cassette domain-containing protein [Psychrobacter lutiphocae]